MIECGKVILDYEMSVLLCVFFSPSYLYGVNARRFVEIMRV
jgi:hypothetical protein